MPRPFTLAIVQVNGFWLYIFRQDVYSLDFCKMRWHYSIKLYEIYWHTEYCIVFYIKHNINSHIFMYIYCYWAGHLLLFVRVVRLIDCMMQDNQVERYIIPLIPYSCGYCTVPFINFLHLLQHPRLVVVSESLFQHLSFPLPSKRQHLSCDDLSVFTYAHIWRPTGGDQNRWGNHMVSSTWWVQLLWGGTSVKDGTCRIAITVLHCNLLCVLMYDK